MKILNVAETTQGGIETFFESLSRSQFVENHFLAFGYHRTELVLNDKGFRPFNVLFLLWVLYFKLDTKQYQVIFLHSTFAGLLRPFLWPLAKWRNIKLVYCSHGWAFDIHYDSLWKERVYKTVYIIVEKILALFCDKIYCISLHEYRSAINIGMSASKVALVWNGVKGSERVTDLVRNDDETTRILFVGRLDKQKGLDRFVDTLKNTEQWLSPIELSVIGEPVRNDCPELTTLLNEPIDKVTIHQLGWVKNTELDSHIQQADFVVVPSLWEGFGLIVAEAFRNGTPVLASNAGSLVDMVTDKTGWVFEQEQPDSLLNLTTRLLNDKLYKDIERSDCIAHFNQYFHEDVMNENYYHSFIELN
ncbi:glycosyltransferase family 4 protein [Vibrio sp. 404]|uniref:Glycosyltransferase family 4 protein n=1 Tax=Vibrio marinisediminis TaxID=2758441 RepID=A0A7W2FT85_9VIBR|nr:glycosyltransferase family 4 protein [Vibrio marinisediminis]MBA5763775.1 glycosyltransferase family 4 protein [Vibrio marinisediminis]